MKRILTVALALALMIAVFLPAATATAASADELTGCKIALQADTGQWFTRCRGCQQAYFNGTNFNEDTVTVHVNDPDGAPYAQFEMIDLGNGKVALRSDLGQYVARCNGCVSGGAYPDFVTIHVTDPSVPYAQFDLELLPNGKYALKADTGKYVSRCNGCSPTAAYPDTVTIHVNDPSDAPYAQWRLVYLP